MASKILCVDAYAHALTNTLQQIEHVGMPAIGVQSVRCALQLMQIAQPRFVLLALDLPQAEIQLFLNELSNLGNIPMIALAKESSSQSLINERKFGQYFSQTVHYPLDEAELRLLLAGFAATD